MVMLFVCVSIYQAYEIRSLVMEAGLEVQGFMLPSIYSQNELNPPLETSTGDTCLDPTTATSHNTTSSSIIILEGGEPLPVVRRC